MIDTQTKNIKEINEELNLSLKQTFGENTDLSQNSVLGNLKIPFAIVLGYTHELIDYIITQINPRTAKGVWLDIICSLSNVYRKKNSKSQGVVTFVGNSGTDVVAGTKVTTNDNIEFLTIKTFTIIGSKFDAEVQSVEFGIPAVAANTIVNIEPTEGITAVTNQNPTQAGQLKETDAQLRQRRENSTAMNSNSTKEAIWSTLLDLEGVRKAFVFESDQKKSIPTEAYTGELPPSYFYILVDGGNDSQIAQAIAKTKTAGIPTIGNHSASYTDLTGETTTYYFNRPLSVDIKFEISISIVDHELYPQNGIAQIQENLLNYLSLNLTIGQKIFYTRIISAINQVAGMEIDDIKITKGSEPTVTNKSVDMAINEIGNYTLQNIKVMIL